MKYYSEVLGKIFDTTDELIAEEAKQEAEEAKKKAAIEDKKARKKEVDEAYDHARNLIMKYTNDYGVYSRDDALDSDFVARLFNILW